MAHEAQSMKLSAGDWLEFGRSVWLDRGSRRREGGENLTLGEGASIIDLKPKFSFKSPKLVRWKMMARLRDLVFHGSKELVALG